MREKIFRGIVPLLLLAMAAGALCRLAATAGMLEHVLPEATAFRASYGLGVPFGGIIRETEDVEYALAAVKPSLAANVWADYETESIDLMLTDEKYGELVPLEMKYGNYFILSETPEENRFVVISDKLAVRFFLTDRAVGMSLKVDGTECRVCGVYREDTGLLAQASSSGREVVYAPYDLSPGTAPQLLYVQGGGTSFQESLADQAGAAFGQTVYWESASTYSEAVSLGWQIFRGAVFLCGVPVLALLAAGLVRQVKSAAGELREGRKKVKSWLLCLPWAGGIGILLALICFSPEIPSRYLPADNIFDFGFYFRTAIAGIQAQNAASMCDFYWKLSQNGLLACLMWGAIGMALFWMAAVAVAAWVKEEHLGE